MDDQTRSDNRQLLESEFDFEPDFDEIEIGRLTEAEYEAANLRHELFLVREREELEVLEREFDEELSQLFSMTRADDVGRNQPDPPGWPGL
ncbi:MAG: hypothetical protein JST85_18190 [Acidobacteria bacterium]|nr:hypothetical protein [Acidobacteriota bacterium]